MAAPDDSLRLGIVSKQAGLLCASRGATEARSATGWLRERTKRLINVRRRSTACRKPLAVLVTSWRLARAPVAAVPSFWGMTNAKNKLRDATTSR
jgi:hypothetical protein